jgi:DNA-binding response OmpR family regulator
MAYKILIADDDPDIVEFLKKRLIQESYDVIEAFDGEEALRKVEEDNPDIILLDLTMPRKNGFEVLQEIRTRFKDKWRPVIIISANTELEAVKKSYNLEADHYLSKPCSIENVLKGIRIMISLIPMRQQI